MKHEIDQTKVTAFALAGLAEGLTWYSDAKRSIRQLCKEMGWDTNYFIDVLAITSPRVQVSRNLRLTQQVMLGVHSPESLLPSTRAALAYYQDTGKIRGPKTKAFAQALRGDRAALVLDVWMARALDIPHNQVTGVKFRRDVVPQLGEVMARTGVHNLRDLQACIWCGIIRAHGKVPGKFLFDELTWGKV